MQLNSSSISIFVTGNSRSGTTMMSRILGNHKDVFAFQELHFFDELIPGDKAASEIQKINAVKLFAKLVSIQRDGYFGSGNIVQYLEEAAAILSNKGIRNYIDVYSHFLISESNRNKCNISCEQTPQNIFSLDEILKHFPSPKIIIMVRDPREVLLSQKHKWKRRKLSGGAIPFWESIRSRINYHPITISKIWNSVMKTAAKYSTHPAVLIVRYEDLIAEPVNTIKNVCAHTGIEYNENMTDIPVVGSSNFNDNQSKRGIDTTKTRQWENGGLSTEEIHLCQKITGNLMQNYGYNLKEVEPNSIVLLWIQITMPFRLGLALLFNLKRLKNPLKLLKRFS